jgi:hypothetical protein
MRITSHRKGKAAGRASSHRSIALHSAGVRDARGHGGASSMTTGFAPCAEAGRPIVRRNMLRQLTGSGDADRGSFLRAIDAQHNDRISHA